MICTLNPTQTLHWNVQNPTLKPTQTLHWNRPKTYTDVVKTLHKNYTRKPTPQSYILFFEHESNEWNEREWIVRNERNKRDEQNEHGVTPSSRLVTFSLTSGLGAQPVKTRSAPKKN